MVITPDPSDTRDTIADCMDTLRIAAGSAERRRQVVDNCVAPLNLLFHALEMVNAAGPEEEAVFAYFLRVLQSQMRPTPHASLVGGTPTASMAK